jgi:hypothetical protein
MTRRNQKDLKKCPSCWGRAFNLRNEGGDTSKTGSIAGRSLFLLLAENVPKNIAPGTPEYLFWLGDFGGE